MTDLHNDVCALCGINHIQDGYKSPDPVDDTLLREKALMYAIQIKEKKLSDYPIGTVTKMLHRWLSEGETL